MRELRERLLNRLGFLVRRLDPLTQMMNAAGSDKGFGVRGRHYYTRIYRKLFAPLRELPIVFVEIGLLRTDYDRRRYGNAHEKTQGAMSFSKCSSAPSLYAWRRFFPNAQIIGFDIDDFSEVRIPNVTILQGDMSNVNDLSKIIEAAGGQIDVLIDDGSHLSHHQQIAFAKLFPHIASGGLYIIEDCHWQDNKLEKNNVMKTRDMFNLFRRDGKIISQFIDESASNLLSYQICSVALHDSIEIGIEDTEDALCVVRKK